MLSCTAILLLVPLACLCRHLHGCWVSKQRFIEYIYNYDGTRCTCSTYLDRSGVCIYVKYFDDLHSTTLICPHNSAKDQGIVSKKKSKVYL